MQSGLHSTLAGIIIGHGSVGPLFQQGAVTAAGEDATDAAELPHACNLVAGADGAKGVILPVPAKAGQVLLVANLDGSDALKIYPHDGGAINGGTTDAAIEQKYSTLAMFVATSATNWAAIYTAHVAE